MPRPLNQQGPGKPPSTETTSTPHPLPAHEGHWNYLSRRGFLQLVHSFSQLAVCNLLLF